MSRRRLVLVAVLVVVAVAAAALVVRWRAQRRRAEARQLAARLLAATARVEGCLLGPGALPDAPGALEARARRMALGEGEPSWPAPCAALADALARDALTAPEDTAVRAVGAAAIGLSEALAREGTPEAVRDFRAARADARVTAWAGALASLHRAATALADRAGAGAVVPARGARVPHPGVTADLLPVSVSPGATLAGWNVAAGTLSMLFIEPDRTRLFCRSRDRGATIRCRRLASDPARGDVAALVPSDRAEALLLAIRADGATVESVDTPGVAVFTLSSPPVWSLGARVVGDVLYATVEGAPAPWIERVARGGARRAREPSGSAPRLESVVLAPGAPPGASPGAPTGAWWLGQREDAPSGVGARALVARALPPDLAARAGEPVPLAPVRSRAALVLGCSAGDVAYVAVVDAPGGAVVAVDARGARLLGSLEQADLPATLACDGEGATLAGATTVQSCARRGGCGPRTRLEGVRRFARVGGELVAVTVGHGGALRAYRAAPDGIAAAAPMPVADDGAHGGVSARALWLLAADDRLVLVAAGELTTVLYSTDRGRSWRSSRESMETPSPRFVPFEPPRRGGRGHRRP